jgi:hypothetical protein
MMRSSVTAIIFLTNTLFTQSFDFVDQAGRNGLEFDHDHGGSGEKFYVETMGSGVCLLDYDNDNDLDIYFCQGAPLPGWGKNLKLENKLFRNDGERWTDVSKSAGIADESYSIGCACGDIDNDGDTDLYVTNYGEDTFYLNNGDGTFSDQTNTVGLFNDEWGSSAVFFDMDNDGWLDLYVTNYVEFITDKNPWCGDHQSGKRAYCDPDIFKGVPDKLFQNMGNGTFQDISKEAGISNQQGKGLGVVPGDIDGDGDLDLYVANDKVMNHLYINDGQGGFSEDALFAGVGYNENGRAEAGMGVDFSDVNQDGWLDLFVTNFSGESNTLYINDRSGSFVDQTFLAGLGQPSLNYLGFGTKFIDLNYDGYQDIFVANGHVIDNIQHFNKGYSHAQKKQIFLGDGSASFTEVSSDEIGDAKTPSVGRGAAFGDLDNDGDIDIVISNNNGPANLLIRSGKPNLNWIGFELVGHQSNREGIGSRIEIESNGDKQTQFVSMGGSYLSSNDKRVLFGLNKNQAIDRLTIQWPSGLLAVFENMKANHYYIIEEGGKPSILQY